MSHKIFELRICAAAVPPPFFFSVYYEKSAKNIKSTQKIFRVPIQKKRGSDCPLRKASLHKEKKVTASERNLAKKMRRHFCSKKNDCLHEKKARDLAKKKRSV